MIFSDSPSTSFAERRALCPGFYNMPKAADGHLCRIKLSLGAVSLRQLARIADLAEKYGSGDIELTTRGNIQLRGIKAEHRENLSAALTKIGLAPYARNGDDARNIMINPTAGFGLHGNKFALNLAEKLLNEIQTNPQYQTLSPKFSFYIDGGEDCAVPDHDNDIWVSFLPHSLGQEALCCIGLTSPLPRGQNDSRANILGIAPIADILPVIRRILDLFLEAAESSGLYRIKDWLNLRSPDVIFRDMQTALRPASEAADAYFPARWRRIARETACADIDFAMKSLALGVHQTCLAGQYYFGTAPHLGRFSAETLRVFAKIAEQVLPQTPLRVTAQQTLIFSSCPRKIAEQARKHFTDEGFIANSNNIYAHMLCCAGAPFCAKGQANVQKAAAYLAEALKNSETAVKKSGIIHLTGCPKSCAATEAENFTLLALDSETYAVYKSSANTGISGESRFGLLLAPKLNIKEIPLFLEKHIIP